MIGWTRFILSLVVMEGHLSLNLGMGRTAVVIFYLISGMVITKVFTERYKKDAKTFLLNRVLRLYPIYWICYFGFMTAWALIGTDVYGMGIPAFPDNVLELLGVVVPSVFIQSASVIPQAFVIAWEMLCYLMVSAGLFLTASRSLSVTVMALVVSNHIYSASHWQNFYFSPFCAIAFFGLGSLAYWHGLKLEKDAGLSAMVGALSYPIFLCHWGIGSIIATVFDLASGWGLFFASLPPTLALSWILVIAIERPIARYRQRLKSSTP